jgi:hypothetical protein
MDDRQKLLQEDKVAIPLAEDQPSAVIWQGAKPW